jgi:BirA family biotin operon repressor/biotin-[acetyl-CoA-carboxylase] ligase
LLADASALEGDWLIALEQEAGRGRQGRAWVSAPGNFYGSTPVQLRPNDPPAPSLSLAAGLALVEAIDVAVPGQTLMLKWPNDALLLGRKLAGILLERTGDRVAVGFGVNLTTAPTLADRQAALKRSRRSLPAISHGCSISGGRANPVCSRRHG